MSNSLNKMIARCLLALTMLLSAIAQADDYHYINSPVGNRAADMAGAYTALSDDPTGLFYNPSGIVYSPGSNLSASMNTFQQGETTYKNVLGGQYNWTRSSTALLPNFFGVVQPVGKGIFGFSYAVPNSTNEDQDQVFDNIATTLGTAREFIINFNNTDNTYNVGPSYAYEINDKLSIGATLYFHFRRAQRISNILLLYTNDRLWSNEYYQLEETGIKPILGIMWSPASKLSLGATVSKINILDSEITVHNSCLGANGSAASSLCVPNNIVKHEVIVNNQETDYPLKVTFGAAWFPSDTNLFTADVIYHESTGSGNNARESVLNIAIGNEYYLSPRWALRSGFFTDFANTPTLQQNISTYNQAEHIDLYGISLGINHFNRNSSLSLGMTYSVGSGKAQIIGGSTTLQDVDMYNLGINLAASYAY